MQKVMKSLNDFKIAINQNLLEVSWPSLIYIPKILIYPFLFTCFQILKKLYIFNSSSSKLFGGSFTFFNCSSYNLNFYI